MGRDKYNVHLGVPVHREHGPPGSAQQIEVVHVARNGLLGDRPGHVGVKVGVFTVLALTTLGMARPWS